MPKTTPELRGKIINLHEAGIKKTSIATQLNINVKTVDLWIRREKEEGNLFPKKGKPRDRCTSYEDDKKIIDFVKENPLTTRAEILREVEVNCSASTITRRLKENDINYCSQAQKSELTSVHKEQ